MGRCDVCGHRSGNRCPACADDGQHPAPVRVTEAPPWPPEFGDPVRHAWTAAALELGRLYAEAVGLTCRLEGRRRLVFRRTTPDRISEAGVDLGEAWDPSEDLTAIHAALAEAAALFAERAAG